ncbi:MAG: hypothetical protein ACLR2G_08675 [Phascolarctobacterium faecium]
MIALAEAYTIENMGRWQNICCGCALRQAGARRLLLQIRLAAIS